MRIQTSVRANLSTLRTTLSYALVGGLLIAANGFETDCGLDDNEPCKVFSYDDLQNVEKNGLNRKYVLMKDIHAPTNPPDNFNPIGGGSWKEEAFTGCFDGNGKAIHNLFISCENVAQHGPLGLFGGVSGTAEISNLILKHPTVTLWSMDAPYYDGGHVGVDAGALIGRVLSEEVRVEDVVIDNPNVSGSGSVGGLIGEGGPYISRCHVLGGTAFSPRGSLGGLVGHASPPRIKSSSAENVHLTSQNEFSNLFISRSYCGGLIGVGDSGGITDSFATGNISCETAGGLVGHLNRPIQISSSYSVFNLTVGVVSSSNFVKSRGLVGTMSAAPGSRRPVVTNGIPVVKDSFSVSEITTVSTSMQEESCVYDIKYHGGLSFTLYCRNGRPDVGNPKHKQFPGQPPIVVTSPDYYLDEESEPVINWDSDSWTFEAGKYPSINKWFVDPGGPYKDNVAGNPVHLDRATASEGSYRWTVKSITNNTRCSISDASVLQPVLTCTGNAKSIAKVCLTVSNDIKKLRHCTRVTFQRAVVKCGISPCRKSAVLQEKREKMINDLESILTQLNELPDKYESISWDYRGFHYRIILKEARENLVKGQITLAGIRQGKEQLMELLHRLEGDVTFRIISKKDYVGIESKIRSALKQAGILEVGYCDLPEN